VPSPSGEHHAVVFQRDCGAITAVVIGLPALAALHWRPRCGKTLTLSDELMRSDLAPTRPCVSINYS
jgi:hypothetical protein